MAKPYENWMVLPHGALTEIDDGILTVVGQLRMPLMDLPRRMTVVRLADRRLVIWSAIALDDAQMATLGAYGEPAFMIVPNDHHRLDAHAWKARYPSLQVIAPPGARDKIAEVVAVDTTAPQFGDPRVEFVTVPGTREHEAALVVRTSSGATLVLNDVVGNIRHASGIDGWLLKIAGFAGDEAQVPRVVKMGMIKDKAALREQLLQWSEIANLKRVIVSHGDPIEADPRQTLRELAQSLD